MQTISVVSVFFQIIMAIFTKKIKEFSRQNFSKGIAIHRISNVYLSYI